MVPETVASVRESRFLRDAGATTIFFALLYLLAPVVDVQALQIPGYLLIVGFDVLEAVFGPVQSGYEFVFGLYLVALGLSAASLAHGFRAVSASTSLPAWRVGIAAALAIIAGIALLYGAIIYASTTQTEPVKILAGTGVLLLVLAALFADAFDVTTRFARGR